MSVPIDAFQQFVSEFPDWRLQLWFSGGDLYTLAYGQVNQSQTNYNPDSVVQGYFDPVNQYFTTESGPLAPFWLHAIESVALENGVLTFSTAGQTFTFNGAAGTMSVNKTQSDFGLGQ